LISFYYDTFRKDFSEGIRIKIDVTLGQARKKLQMDIGFGDVIIPLAMQIEFPTLLEEKLLSLITHWFFGQNSIEMKEDKSSGLSSSVNHDFMM